MLKIGAHFSIAGGIDNSYKEAQSINANCVQIFSKSPRGWNFGDYSDEILSKVLEKEKNYDLSYKMIHSVYLINLAKAYAEAEVDRGSVVDDFRTASRLGFDSVNIHLGKYKELSKEEAFKNMKENLEDIFEKIKDYSDVEFLFENTAGQGSEIGYNFEELGEFFNYLGEDISKKIGVCFDSAHAWGAGYNLNNFDEVLKEFDKYIGIKKLKVFHLNDSKAILGSKLDRHASLGKGFIGLPALSQVIRWAESNSIPMMLETPNPDIWGEEIEMIKEIIDGKFDIESFHKVNFKTEFLKKYEKVAKNNLIEIGIGV